MIIVFLFSRILPRFSNLQQCFQAIANSMPSFRAVLNMEAQFKAGKEPDVDENNYGNEDEIQACDVHGRGGVTRDGYDGHDRNGHLVDFRPFTLEKALCFESVSFRYDKTRPDWTLRNIDIQIPANAMTAIVGHSGAGKSSVADLILGLLTPDKGRIIIDGTVLSDKLLQHWRQRVGYVPQETFLFHESIRDNLLKAQPDASDVQLWEALESASARTFVSNLPHGLDTVVGDRGIKLSGGERQRIALARALLREPLLLLLDEATSSLDTKNELHIQDALEKLQGQLTLVVIAHRFSTVENADHVVHLNHGRVAGNDILINQERA
jgi:ATP-binding cassette subfamily C protein